MRLSKDMQLDVNDQIFIRFPAYLVFFISAASSATVLYCGRSLFSRKPSKQTKVCAVSLGKRRKRVHWEQLSVKGETQIAPDQRFPAHTALNRGRAARPTETVFGSGPDCGVSAGQGKQLYIRLSAWRE